MFLKQQPPPGGLQGPLVIGGVTFMKINKTWIQNSLKLEHKAVKVRVGAAVLTGSASCELKSL